MNQPPRNPVIHDIHTFLEGGIPGFLDKGGSFEELPQRLRTAYAVSWRVIHDTMFTSGIDEEPATNPEQQVAKLFDRVLTDDDAPLRPYITFGLTGYWSRTESNMLEAILFEHQDSDTYDDHRVAEDVAEILRWGSSEAQPDMTAHTLLHYAAAVLITQPEDQAIDIAEARSGVRRILGM